MLHRIATTLVVAVLAWIPPHDGRAGVDPNLRSLHLDAVIAAGGQPLEAAADLTVRRLDAGRAGAVVARRDALPAELALRPGRYRATIAYRDTKVRREFTVTGEPAQRRVFDLHAGLVRLGILSHVGGRTLDRPVRWRLRTYGRDAAGRRLTVAEATEARPEFLLSQGYYVAEAEVAGTKVSHAIEVKAGRSFDYTLTLNAGTLRVRAGADDDPAVSWSVYRQGAAEGEEPVQVARGPEGRFLLQAGRYRVVAQGGGERGETAVAIEPGRIRLVDLPLR